MMTTRLTPRHSRATPISICAIALAAIAFTTRATRAAPPLYPPDHPWNQQITSAPVAPNSAAIMDSIISTFGNNRLHPDFGQDSQTGNDLYGVPYNVVHGNGMTPVSVVVGIYANQSDVQPAPIPDNAVLEGDYQNGPRLGLSARGDSHLIVWDHDTNIVYEYYRCSRPGENPDGLWHADSQTVWNMSTNQFRTLGWTSADAAGLSILAGLARPDEGLPVSQGGQGIIRHAIRFTLTNSVILHKYIYPASHVANPGNTNTAIMPPMGSRFRLKASVNISGLNPQSKIIAQAMKDYGLILADNGSNFFFTGASRSPAIDAQPPQPSLTWNDNDIQSTTTGLKSLRFADFEMVDLRPIVTGISPAAAPAGAQITITGQNFSGAAGQLRVLFGPATANIASFTDTQIIATVPPGTGSVDVRVQSGANTPHSQNINNPIFGYGISEVVPAARFTYGASDPTVICCRGAICSLIPQSTCLPPTTSAGASIAPGAACNTPASTTTPCCTADYNKTAGITVQDIFAFLADWFNASPYAAAGNTGAPATPTVQNIFNFLGAWFESGC